MLSNVTNRKTRGMKERKVTENGITEKYKIMLEGDITLFLVFRQAIFLKP
jgi:hypothetical protein